MDQQAIINYWSSFKEIIDSICKDYDSLWQKRSRILNSKLIVMMIFKLILSDKRQGLNSNLSEFWDRCGEKKIDLPQPKAITASSFCEARQKVPENIFTDLNQALLENWAKTTPLPLLHGHRVYAVDGSRINLPRNLTKFGFKIYDKERRHYPQGLLSCLYDVLSKTVNDFEVVSHMNERKCALNHLNTLKKNDIVLFDRGYFSYLMLHEFHKKDVHAIFRLQEGSVNKAIEAFIKSSKVDTIIEYIPSSAVISDLKKQGHFLKPHPIPLRLIKQTIKGETYLYGTTLKEKKYSPEFFSSLYHERWSIEELYKISKIFINIEDFHAKTERGIKQEIYAHLLLINLSRLFEFNAQDGLPPMNKEDQEMCKKVNFYKLFNPKSMFNINFKNCLMVVGRYLENLFLDTFDEVKNWVAKIIPMILRVRQKIRPGRSFPRVSFAIQRRWVRKQSKTSGYS